MTSVRDEGQRRHRAREERRRRGGRAQGRDAPDEARDRPGDGARGTRARREGADGAAGDDQRERPGQQRRPAQDAQSVKGASGGGVTPIHEH
jgi:hypothetical protein